MNGRHQGEMTQSRLNLMMKGEKWTEGRENM